MGQFQLILKGSLSVYYCNYFLVASSLFAYILLHKRDQHILHNTRLFQFKKTAHVKCIYWRFLLQKKKIK